MLLALLATAWLAACRREDVRPWMICYRVYDQCEEVIGALTREQCETQMARQPPQVVAALVDCVRIRPCPGIARACASAHVPALLRPGR